MRKFLIKKLTEVGLDAKLFGLHNLRSRGVTVVASGGVPDRWFRRHRQWLSENAKDGYMKDELKDRLSVTKNLGL